MLLVSVHTGAKINFNGIHPLYLFTKCACGRVEMGHIYNPCFPANLEVIRFSDSEL